MTSERGDGGDEGWEQLPTALRMAAMSGRVHPRYTSERKRADEALPSALHEKVSERSATPRYSWDRGGATASQQRLTTTTLREEADAMRRRLAQLGGGGKSPSSAATAGSNEAALAAVTSGRATRPDPRAAGKDDHRQHSCDMLTKKLQKVEKLLDKEAPGTKEHRKLLKKREEYQNQLKETEADVDQKQVKETQADVGSSRIGNDNHDSGTHDGVVEERSSATLTKKLQKVEKLLETEAPGTKEYRKLLKKRVEYQNQLKEMEAEANCSRDGNDDHDSASGDEATEAAAAAATARARTERLRLEARRKRDEAEREAAAQYGIRQQAQEQEDAENEAIEEDQLERNRCRREDQSAAANGAGERERQRKESFREEARRLKQEALDNKHRHAEEVEEAERERKEAFREEARRLKQEALEKRQRQEEAAEEVERERKEAFREEARRLKQEALEKRQRQEEDAVEAERERKQAIRDEARSLKQAAMEKRQKDEDMAEEEERKRKEARLGEERRLKEQATDRQRQEEASDDEAALLRPTYETDDKKRKKVFLEEARRLKQEASEKKRIEDDLLCSTKSAYEWDEQKRREVFMEEARRLKADAMAQMEVEEAEKLARDEADEERHRAVAEDDSRMRQAQMTEAESPRNALVEARRLDQEGVEQQHMFAKDEHLSASSKGGRQEASQDFLDRRALIEPFSDNTKKILLELENMERRQKKLEKSLTQNAIPIIEEIPYEVAKDKISEITDSMKELASADMDSYQMEKKYFLLEEKLAKYTTALMLTDEYAEEQHRLELEWEVAVEADNVVAIRKLRSHMPITIRSLTEDDLAATPTPNGKILPKVLARKFKRTNVLQLIRVNPDDIEKMHPSLLEGMRTTGLTLTERRALHEHLRHVGYRWQDRQSDPSAEKKFQWFLGLKVKFKESLNAYTRHVEQYGPPGNHPYAKRNDPGGGGCPMIGNQCPLKADDATDYSEDYGFTQESEYEISDSQRSGCTGTTTSSRRSIAPLSKTSAKSKVSDNELLEDLRALLRLDLHESDVDKKLLRELFHADKRTKSLEKQLMQNGLALPQEDIPYGVAKAKVAELTEEIKLVATSMGNTSDSKEIARLECEFGKLSQEMDKYNNALMLTKEWAQEQGDKEREWDVRVSPGNYKALQKIWRHMPVDIRDMSETRLTSELTPNGEVIPKPMAKKFKRTNVLMLLRMDPASIEPMHPSSLEAMRTTGLTLTERRALHEHLKNVAPKWKSMASDKMSERKWMWHESLKSKLKQELEKFDKHVEQCGPPGNHNCSLIGNQCPLKADLATDYTGDLGFPDHAQYGTQSVAKSNLLSMEDIERRRREDEIEYGGYCSTHTETVSDDFRAGAPAPAPSRPSRPLGGMSGLLAAIKKTPSHEDDLTPAQLKPLGPSRGMGNLMAEIQKVPKKESAPHATTEVEGSKGEAIAKKRGILAKLTGKNTS